jgi:hypothetical protein
MGDFANIETRRYPNPVKSYLANWFVLLHD